MDLRVADRARLILDSLVMERRDARRSEIAGDSVALQAERVHIAPGKQSRIGRAVRVVAGCAAFDFDYRMLKNKRPRRFRMALHADGIHLGRSLKALLLEGSMRIVAVAAAHQTLIHLVMEGL